MEQNFVIKKFEENKGFEEIQAQIYNEAVGKYNGPKVTAQDIKTRVINDKKAGSIDFDGIFYAFDKNNKPLAYIQYRATKDSKTGKTEINMGYPWAIQGCPQSVQDELHTKLLTHIKAKYPKDDIFLGFISDKFTDVHKDIVRRNFKLNESNDVFQTSFGDLAQLKTKPNYTFKLATKDDLNILVELALKDENMSEMGKDGLTNYFRDRVLQQGPCGLVFKNNELTCATAILPDWQSKGSLYRFNANPKKDKDAYTFLIQKLAEEGKKGNYGNGKANFQTNEKNSNFFITKLVKGTFIEKSLQYKLAK